MSTRREPRITAIEERLNRVAIRQVVSEVMLATTVGFVLRSVGEDLRKQILAELRKSVSATGPSENVALEMEEQAAQLIDQIERLARIEIKK
jgi:hypothetical protein